MAFPARILLPSLFLLCFAAGYLLGDHQGGGRGAPGLDQPHADSAELLALQRDLLYALRELRDSRPLASGNTSGAAARALSTPERGARLPSLDPVLERLDQAVRQLEQMAQVAQSHPVQDQASVVRLARSGEFPRQTRAISAYCRRLEQAAESESGDIESIEKEVLLMSSSEILHHFGAPDEIYAAAPMVWNYLEYWELPDGDQRGWELELSFSQGMVSGVGWTWLMDS